MTIKSITSSDSTVTVTIDIALIYRWQAMLSMASAFCLDDENIYLSKRLIQLKKEIQLLLPEGHGDGRIDDA